MTELFAKMGIKQGSFLATVLVLLVGSLLVSIVSRLIFGKKSNVSSAISSAIGILFIYAVTITLRSTDIVDAKYIAPLPFIVFSDNTLSLFRFAGADYTAICSNLLSAVILAFTVNLADSWLPKGKKVISWFILRVLTVAIGYGLHLIVVGLFTKYLPEGLVIYAPTVLLALLIIMLLTGALKILVGAVLVTVNPIIGGLYTFFFAMVIGKMVSKAMLTAALLSALVLALNYLGISTISVAVSALPAYIPLVVALAGLWFVQHKFF